MAKADPAAFDRFLVSQGKTKAELARMTGIGRNTIQSVAKGNPCHPGTLDVIAEALGADVDELCGRQKVRSEAELREEFRNRGFIRLNIHLSSRMALNYQLVADRYGLTTDAIIQAGPLCFTLLAELSLKRRREAITRLCDAVPASDEGFEHLPLVKTGIARFETAHELEIASIKSRDLDGRQADPDGENDSAGAFTAFIRDLIGETGIPEEDELGMEAFDSMSHYRLFGEHLQSISGGSRRAEFALDKRYTTIQHIPKDLRRAENETADVTSRRVAWLEDKVPEAVWQEEEARWAALLADFDLDDLLLISTDGGSNA